MTAAANTGPANGPLPASSHPASIRSSCRKLNSSCLVRILQKYAFYCSSPIFFLSMAIISFLLAIVSSSKATIFSRSLILVMSVSILPEYSSCISLRDPSDSEGRYPRTSSSVLVPVTSAILYTLLFTMDVSPFSRSRYAVREIPSL